MEMWRYASNGQYRGWFYHLSNLGGLESAGLGEGGTGGGGSGRRWAGMGRRGAPAAPLPVPASFRRLRAVSALAADTHDPGASNRHTHTRRISRGPGLNSAISPFLAPFCI